MPQLPTSVSVVLFVCIHRIVCFFDINSQIDKEPISFLSLWVSLGVCANNCSSTDFISLAWYHDLTYIHIIPYKNIFNLFEINL